MATLNFVQALITLWNERVEYYNLKSFHGMTPVDNPPQTKSIEGFMEFMRGQTVSLFDGQSMYYYEDVSRYLHGQEVVD